MKWIPEITPQVQSSRETIMEWLNRSYRKISDWTSSHLNIEEDPHPQYVPKGYGGLVLSAPFTPGTPIVLTTSFQKIAGFDQEVVANPVDVEGDIPNDRFRVRQSGSWVFNFNAVGEITPFTGNVAQTIEIAVYNETLALSTLVGFHAVPRYADIFDIPVSGMTDVPVSAIGVDDWISLWVRQRYATPAISITTLIDLEMSCNRVG